MWVRGLKSSEEGESDEGSGVAPHVGAWIEIVGHPDICKDQSVAPHVGAWIEIISDRQ